ncbi:MAG TPA: desulfoferrodoxin family protein [Anaerovoracaceae bacterium]|nr:desulfoferrodoxin family protein [Anaerovoracaceae bacterium]
MDNVLFYNCTKCGNVVMSLKDYGSDMSCCGESMVKLVANSTEAANEKHLPIVDVDGSKITVTVGSVYHPMNPEHYIEWIAIVMGEKVEIVHLKPGVLPKAIFTYESLQEEEGFTEEENQFLANCEGQPCNFVYDEEPLMKVTVYAYCNIHGLWKTVIEY